MQGFLSALLDFMYQLEHLAVLLALLNVKGSTRTGPQWRKSKYAKVIQLLEGVRTDQHFGDDIAAVVKDMWDKKVLPDLIAKAKRLSGPQLGKPQPADVETACERLEHMDLYVDTPADQKNEDAGVDGKHVAVEDEGEESSHEEEEAEDVGTTQGDEGIDDIGRIHPACPHMTCLPAECGGLSCKACSEIDGLLLLFCTYRCVLL